MFVCSQNVLFKAWLRLFSQDWPLIVHCVEISVNTVWEYITQVDTLWYITQVDTLEYISQVDTRGYMTQVDTIDYITQEYIAYEHTSNNSMLHYITRINMTQVKINCTIYTDKHRYAYKKSTQQDNFSIHCISLRMS